jgi:hypothetical protein
MLKSLSDTVKMELVAMLSASVVNKEEVVEPELTDEERKRSRAMVHANRWHFMQLYRSVSFASCYLLFGHADALGPYVAERKGQFHVAKRDL